MVLFFPPSDIITSEHPFACSISNDQVLKTNLDSLMAPSSKLEKKKGKEKKKNEEGEEEKRAIKNKPV